MSQFTPNVPPPPGAFAPPPQAPRGTNAWAIVSLITGILGCLFITPFVATVTGIIGFIQGKRNGGRVMSVIGILLGIIWIVGAIGLGGLTYVGVKMAIKQAKTQSIETVNAMADGDVGKARALSDLPADQVQALSDQLKGYGHCTDLSVSSFDTNKNMGSATFHLKGTATFEKAGTKGFDASLGQSGDGQPKLTDLKID